MRFLVLILVLPLIGVLSLLGILGELVFPDDGYQKTGPRRRH